MLDVNHLTQFNKQDLLECGYGNMFGPGGAQLPIDKMLMLDRITSITKEGGKAGKGQIIANSISILIFGFLTVISKKTPLCLGA